jgi:hypothetical protein
MMVKRRQHAGRRLDISRLLGNCVWIAKTGQDLPGRQGPGRGRLVDRPMGGLNLDIAAQRGVADFQPGHPAPASRIQRKRRHSRASHKFETIAG